MLGGLDPLECTYVTKNESSFFKVGEVRSFSNCDLINWNNDVKEIYSEGLKFNNLTVEFENDKLMHLRITNGLQYVSMEALNTARFLLVKSKGRPVPVNTKKIVDLDEEEFAEDLRNVEKLIYDNKDLYMTSYSIDVSKLRSIRLLFLDKLREVLNKVSETIYNLLKESELLKETEREEFLNSDVLNLFLLNYIILSYNRISRLKDKHNYIDEKFIADDFLIKEVPKCLCIILSSDYNYNNWNAKEIKALTYAEHIVNQEKLKVKYYTSSDYVLYSKRGNYIMMTMIIIIPILLFVLFLKSIK